MIPAKSSMERSLRLGKLFKMTGYTDGEGKFYRDAWIIAIAADAGYDTIGRVVMVHEKYEVEYPDHISWLKDEGESPKWSVGSIYSMSGWRHKHEIKGKEAKEILLMEDL